MMQPGAGTVFDQGRYIDADAAAVQAVVFLVDDFGDECPGRLRVSGRKPFHDTYNKVFFSFIIHQPSVSLAAHPVKEIRGLGASRKPRRLEDRRGFRPTATCRR